jgi:hypothetical protein
VDKTPLTARSFNLLKETANTVRDQAGLGDQKARVGIVLDISKSMTALYREGTVQRVAERILALACGFDDDGSVDAWAFGEKAHTLAPLTESQFNGWVDRDVLSAVRWEYGTNYAQPIKLIDKTYTKTPGDPAYVLFLTDGDCGDKTDTKKIITKASEHPIFWQFVGLGGTKAFRFLEQLDDLEGRKIDNAGFFAVRDVDAMGDAELFEKMLTEFPSYLKEARRVGIIS